MSAPDPVPLIQEAKMTSAQSPAPTSASVSHATRGVEAPLHTCFEEGGYGEE